MMSASPVDRDKLLDIYLDDHWAGAAAGVELAKRIAGSNRSTPWHADLARVAAAIDDDREVLARLRDRRGRPRSTLKRTLALVGERIGRLKLNGRLLRYSPLSRVVELEMLMAGVQAKQLMWRTLRATDRASFDVSLGELERRAEQQLETLSRIHDEAARAALGDGAGA
jgi:hypothetical protein